MNLNAFNLSDPRPCTDDIPIRSSGTCAFLLLPGGAIKFANSLTEKRRLLQGYKESAAEQRRRKDKPRLFCVWPGQWASHLFELTAEKLSDVVWTDTEYFDMIRDKTR